MGERRRGWRWGLLCMLSAGVALAPAAAYSQTCGFAAGGTLTGIVNTYYPGVGTSAVDATSITVDRSAIRGAATPIAAGDMLLVMQMQDAQINATNDANYGSNGGTGSGVIALNNTGLFEYVVATSGDPGAGTNVAISIVGGSAANGLINSYTTAANTGTVGQKTFQVVRVPRYGSATLSGTLTAAAWNGRTGGILAVDVSGTLTLGGTVSVDGLGFRGAPGQALAGQTGGSSADYRRPVGNTMHGLKGEGIAGTPSTLTGVPGDAGDGYPNGDRARGAPGTAGGGGSDGNPTANDQNTGGGGGANGGNGGRGGSAWPGSNTCPPVQGAQTGGIGGTAMAPAVTRLIMGGGGGAGSRNNNGPSGGGNGGGIVLMRAGAVAATGTITARGIRPPSTANDGGGGGGAGGTIVLLAATGPLTNLTVDASGGVGGYANLPSPPAPDAPPAGVGGVHHGPGGGGGGGVILLSSAPLSSSVAGGASGLTNTCDGDSTTQAYDAQAGAIGVVQTNLTLGSLPGVQVCTVATRATIRGLRVNPAGTVEFTTGSQRGTLAFNVYAAEDPSGKGKLTRLNRRPVPAAVPSSVQPVLYRVDTPPITAPYLMIEEIEVGGHRRLLGPFPVSDATLERAFERVEARIKDEEVQERRGARMLSGRSLGAEHPRALSGGERPSSVSSGEWRSIRGIGPSRPAPGVKIEVTQAGLVSVPFADLVAQGLPATLAAMPGALRLTNLGRPIDFQLVPDASGMPWLTFEAETLSTDYTGSNVYVVAYGPGAPAPAVALTRSGFPAVNGMVRVEKNILYAPFVPQGADPWIWDLLVAGQPAGPYAFDVPSPRAGAAPVHVRVGVVGGSDHVHTVSASINGFAVGRVTFAGQIPAVVEGTLPPGAVQPTGNQLQIIYTAQVASPDEVGLLFLDVVDLAFRQMPHRSVPVPVSRLARYDSAWPGPGGDYLILTHALFLDHAQRIAALKQAEGFRPWVVDVERAYDRYSAGVFEARAIQAFIRDAVKRAGVRYVLLIGGDSYDPRDFSGMGNVSFLPSLDAWDGQFGRVPSENKYADVDGDGLPDVAIGRLPVTTLDEAETVVDKIARQADVLRSAGPTHMFAVDNRGAGDISFLAEAERALSMLPSNSQAGWADIGQGIVQARAALRSGLDAGPLATHYFGHGGFDIWADEGLLTLDDVQALPANRHETILFTWTCETQWYRLHGGINEALLLHPQGGALAALGPAGITDPSLQISVYPRVYQYFFEGATLGEAVRRAKADALVANPSTRPVVEGWNLLGDPALRLDSVPLPR